MVRLGEKDIGQAANALARAFWNDAFMTFIAPDEGQRAEAAHFYFKFMLRYTLIYGEAYTTSPGFEGAALWLPSQYARMTPELIAEAGWEELEHKLGPEFVSRLILIGGATDTRHEYHIKSPHWYLAYIGIDPAFQGAGFAGKLIKPMLERFSVEALPCYLETNTPGNVPLYKHYGFYLLEEFSVPEAKLVFYAMLRG